MAKWEHWLAQSHISKEKFKVKNRDDFFELELRNTQKRRNKRRWITIERHGLDEFML